MTDFTEREKQALAKMDELHDIDPPFELNFISIIEQGTEIREATKKRDENITFGLSALIILVSLALWSFILGTRFMIASQLVLFGIFTLVLIPYVKYREYKEG
ncbi:hypothetical protein [Brevibacillus sp. SYSU BS000544]|uniref:hypothetical protein n=1 Tax=Brevibacillus sp. SYSU BS000544 TaxID=3416443 RepID=UPI003CE4F73F